MRDEQLGPFRLVLLLLLVLVLVLVLVLAAGSASREQEYEHEHEYEQEHEYELLIGHGLGHFAPWHGGGSCPARDLVRPARSSIRV